PNQIAGLRVIGGDEPTDGVVSASVPNDHAPFGDSRRPGNSVGAILGRRLNIPHRRACFCVERYETAIECADIDASTIKRDPAVDYITAYELRVVLRNVRI